MQNIKIGDAVIVDAEVINKASLNYKDGIVIKINHYERGDKFPNWKYPILNPITTAVLNTPIGEDEINICWLSKKQ